MAAFSLIPGKACKASPPGSCVQIHEGQEGVWNSRRGFTKGRLRLTNYLAFGEDTNGSVGEQSAIDVVYLDFSKALVFCTILGDKLDR